MVKVAPHRIGLPPCQASFVSVAGSCLHASVIIADVFNLNRRPGAIYLVI